MWESPKDRVRCSLLPCQVIRMRDLGDEKNPEVNCEIPPKIATISPWSVNSIAFLVPRYAQQWQTYQKVIEGDLEHTWKKQLGRSIKCQSQICLWKRYQCDYAKNGCRWRRRNLILRLFQRLVALFHLRWPIKAANCEPTRRISP